MDLVVLLRAGYLAAALAVVVVSVIPALRTRFLAYGPRAASPSSSVPASVEEEKQRPGKTATNIIAHLLDHVATWQVSHSWFSSFYYLSGGLSIAWLISWLVFPRSGDTAFIMHPRKGSMSVQQVEVAWLMMFAQGMRRLYECRSLQSASSSTKSIMWIGHWLLGLLFYTATSMAIWIEGVPTLQSHTLTRADFSFHAPSLRTILSVLIFLLASGFQHDCHVYLHDLKNSKAKDDKGSARQYKLPEHPAFHSLIAPHYTAECFIYLSLALVAAPKGAWVNWTLASAVVFVVANLGITARDTRQWYHDKFGMKAVEGKWILIPGIY